MSVSLAFDGERLSRENPSLEKLTYAIHLIARHAAQRKINEIIIIGDPNDPCIVSIGALFQFFVTPRYLVRESLSQVLKKQHVPAKIFSKAKTLPPLPTLVTYLNSHADKSSPYREGLSIWKKARGHKSASGKVHKASKSARTTRYVLVGEREVVEVKDPLPLHVRVSVDMKTKNVVSGRDAYGYIGYTVRIASNVESVFTESSIEYTHGVYVPSRGVFSKPDSGNDNNYDNGNGNDHDNNHDHDHDHDHDKETLALQPLPKYVSLVNKDQKQALVVIVSNRTSLRELCDSELVVAEPPLRMDDALVLTVAKV